MGSNQCCNCGISKPFHELYDSIVEGGPGLLCNNCLKMWQITNANPKLQTYDIEYLKPRGLEIVEKFLDNLEKLTNEERKEILCTIHYLNNPYIKFNCSPNSD